MKEETVVFTPSDNNKENLSSNSTLEIETENNYIKEENTKNIAPKKVKFRLEIEKYAVIIVLIWGYSWVIPLYLLYSYYIYIISPNLINLANLNLILHDWKLIAVILVTSFFLITIFLCRLFFVVLFSKIGISYCNYRSPMKELISAQGFGRKEAKDVNYYHLRGVILRILKWEITKSPFPWLFNWAFNFVGVNKIGKGTILEDQFYTQEFLETGENVYIGQGSIVSSHLVEGKYGAITLKKVKIKENTTLSGFNAVSPGCTIEPYAEIMPMGGIPKYEKLKGYSKYFGQPASRISTKRYMKLLDIPENLQPIILETKHKKQKDYISKNINKEEKKT